MWIGLETLWIANRHMDLFMETKYRSETIAGCEAIWLKRLLKVLKESVDKPIPIYCENLDTIQLTRSPLFHAWTKHIGVHYHYIGGWIVEGDIDLRHLNTDVQTVDIFTEALGVDKLR